MADISGDLPRVRDTRSGYTPRTTSIKDALKGNIRPLVKPPESEFSGEENGDGQNVVKDTEQPVNQENLKKIWLEFAKKIKETRPRLANTLNSQLPELNGSAKILIYMENANQMDDFNRYLKTDILAHLKKELENSGIKLETALREKPEDEKRPYTQEEKYKFLSKKNPNLNILKNQLGLDLE